MQLQSLVMHSGKTNNLNMTSKNQTPKPNAVTTALPTDSTEYNYFQSVLENTTSSPTTIERRSCLSSCLSSSSTCACSDRSSSTSTIDSKSSRHVSFAHLIIREYELGLGDHPCVSSGPPVSIGWTYIPETENCISVDDYESTRPPRRSPSQMVMPRALRESLLSDIFEYTAEDIQDAAKKARKVKVQRLRTVRKLNIAPYEEALQGALLRLKRMVQWTTDAKEQRRLWDNVERKSHVRSLSP